jgi:hypothetical protein
LAKVVSIVANGRLLDGADERIQGWSRLNPWLDEINDAGACTVGVSFGGRVSLVRLYDRYLRTAEAVACYRSMLWEQRSAQWTMRGTGATDG